MICANLTTKRKEESKKREVYSSTANAGVWHHAMQQAAVQNHLMPGEPIWMHSSYRHPRGWVVSSSSDTVISDATYIIILVASHLSSGTRFHQLSPLSPSSLASVLSVSLSLVSFFPINRQGTRYSCSLAPMGRFTAPPPHRRSVYMSYCLAGKPLSTALDPSLSISLSLSPSLFLALSFSLSLTYRPASDGMFSVTFQLTGGLRRRSQFRF
ncbi:unnamed protein product [Protopolystoma xenopodis]|uniref:Uncharacterized protein n=1 Tax=Protopolystoma xenopodis TaxID=117903 RepID=A0A3S5AZK7_9PLAT|nr:unnamed protein product [Protopolystoma xenopodis]